MSIKTLSKRIALVVVSTLGIGVLSVVSAPMANAVACSAATTSTPFSVTTTVFGAQDCSATSGRAAISIKQLSGAGNYVTLTADTDASTAASVIKVTGSTIQAAPTNTNGTVSADKTQNVHTSATINGNSLQIATPTAGTVTVTFSTRVDNAGVITDTVVQTFTITVVDRLTVSALRSTSIIETAGTYTNDGTDGVWTSDSGNALATDEVIYAPKGTVTTTGGALSFAEVKVTLNDSAGTLLNATTGTLPTVRAAVRSGTPGTLTWGGAVARDVTAISTEFGLSGGVRVGTLTLLIFQDGTAGASTVDIYVNGTLWSTETMYFYGAPKTVTSERGLWIAPTPTALAGASFGCGSALAACDGSTIALTPAATVTVKDDAGVAVPYATLTATSSDTTVFASSSTSAMTDKPGVYNANISTVAGTTSGKSASISWTSGTTATPSAGIQYWIGGPATSAKLTAVAGPNVGDKGTLKLEKFDAAGNKAFDAFHTVTLSSNVSLTASIFSTGSVTQTGASITVSVLNGVREWTFFNPLVPSSVTFTGTVDALLPISTSFSVSNAALDAALDAANEAIDAANAATDAANLAAEAADAATVAAEEARDAADAATAAVEALATEVATLMAALKAQLTTLANTVAKISKRLKK